MEALCVSSLPSCATTQAGLTVFRHVKGAGRPTNSVLQSRLACRASSYMLGSSNLGSLKVQRKGVRTVVSRGPRCEATEGGGQNSKVDVWIGRAAMLGFVTAISTEIASGKGVLANLGISTPAPTLALALTALVGAILAFGVFRSAAEE
ncbi:unnamed protein product [Calypogeia fissa]